MLKYKHNAERNALRSNNECFGSRGHCGGEGGNCLPQRAFIMRRYTPLYTPRIDCANIIAAVEPPQCITIEYS